MANLSAKSYVQQLCHRFPHSTNSPYVERVIGSIRRDCLNHVIVLNEEHLKRILTEYFESYHHDRTHLGVVNTNRIEEHWDDMLRIAGSLKLGTVSASELIRFLLKSSRPSSLAQAIIEVGRINKTLYLLNYIDDEDYRRRILTQLNRGEERHGVARCICHGQKGEIRKRYREGQEDQLGSLGLVTNAVVLWNTIYMQAALDHLSQQQFEIKEEDEARLSPLLYKHINVLGQYSFLLAESILKGELRPLSQPVEI